MKFFKTLSAVTAFIFTMSFSFIPGTVSAAEVGEAPGLLPMKGIPSHSVSADSLPESQPAAQADPGLEDHRAQVFEAEGDVRILKKGSEDWQKALKDMIIEEGDKIVTGEKSHVDIAYDPYFLNIVRIEEKTKGEFRSIEPTQLFLEDGTLFSALDGLAGKTYQISTPTAVAGVRGTTFDISFEAKTGNLQTHVFPDQSAHLGEIALVGEDGKELKIVEGQGFADGVMGDIPQEKMETAKQFMDDVDAQFSGAREEGLQTLDTSSEKNNEPVEDRLADRGDENKKVGGGPNDGGDSGTGGGLKRQDGGTVSGDLKMDGDVDALVDDAMTPPSVAVSEAGSEAGSHVDRTSEGKQTAVNEAGSGSNKNQADFDKAVEFLGVGGVNSGTQKGREINLGTFFDSKGGGNVEFVNNASSSRSGESVFSGSGTNSIVNDNLKDRGSVSDSQGGSGGFQQPPQQQQQVFDASQFFQPGGGSSTGSGSTVNPNPVVQQEIVKDQVINNNNNNVTGSNSNLNPPASNTDPNKQGGGSGCTTNCVNVNGT